MISVIINHGVILTWALLLTMLYLRQLYRDHQVNQIARLTSRPGIIMISKYHKTGNTLLMLHLGGLLISILLTLHAIDPFMQYIYSVQVVITFSYITTAMIFITLYEGIISLLIKLHIVTNWQSVHSHVKWLHIINIITMIIATACSFVYQFSRKNIYIRIPFYSYIVCVQWFYVTDFAHVRKAISLSISSNKQDASYNIIKSILKKIKFLNMGLVCLAIITTLYQGYYAYKIIQADQTLYIPTGFDLTNSLLVYIQLVTGSTILYFSYVKSNKMGDRSGYSETSKAQSPHRDDTNQPVYNLYNARSNDIPNEHADIHPPPTVHPPPRRRMSIPDSPRSISYIPPPPPLDSASDSYTSITQQEQSNTASDQTTSLDSISELYHITDKNITLPQHLSAIYHEHPVADQYKIHLSKATGKVAIRITPIIEE